MASVDAIRPEPVHGQVPRQHREAGCGRFEGHDPAFRAGPAGLEERIGSEKRADVEDQIAGTNRGSQVVEQGTFIILWYEMAHRRMDAQRLSIHPPWDAASAVGRVQPRRVGGAKHSHRAAVSTETIAQRDGKVTQHDIRRLETMVSLPAPTNGQAPPGGNA